VRVHAKKEGLPSDSPSPHLLPFVSYSLAIMGSLIDNILIY
jgi:hypothetical protein